MKIQKLRLCNFSSYEGENQFDFTTDDNKTIILIGGQNGAGKTSLFTAIKVALYGPLAFGYTGMNAHYVKKIKELINTKAFQNDVLQAGVTIDLAIKQEREIKVYSITRSWTTNGKKIEETYLVESDGRVLKPTERTYFENYLHTILPPDLFDFFLFDGEEVGTIFASERYHTYVRNAMLTLCGLDIFSVIGKFCSSFVDKTDSEENQKIIVQYVHCQNEIEQCVNEVSSAKEAIADCVQEMEQLASEVEACENIFLRAGGISDKTMQKLKAEEAEKDKKRSEFSAKIKSFVEHEMPFYIIRDMIPAVEKQIAYEEKFSIYEYVKYMIPPSFLADVMQDQVPDKEVVSEKLYQAILDKIKPGDVQSEEDMILDLSKDEAGLVSAVMESISSVDRDALIQMIRTRAAYTKDIIAIHQKLRDTLTEEDARRYRLQMDTAKARIQNLQIDKETLEKQLQSSEAELGALKQQEEQLYQQIVANAQNQRVYELTSGIYRITKHLITQKTKTICEQLAEYTLEHLNHIYRKDNLISEIDVEPDFKFHLYQKQDYTLTELQSLLLNVGSKGFLQQIGDKSIAILCEHFQVHDGNELIGEIKAAYSFDGVFHLYKKLDLNRLSKGERQIFILSLYWAMIRISGKEIPFIIDTPYARIDANHREEISRKFFPSISRQVIILSTDEEITQEYYEILKPDIAKEYLLRNDQAENRTTVENRYFFEVSS